MRFLHMTRLKALFPLCILMLLGCGTSDDRFYGITFQNASEDHILFYMADIHAPSAYPDTVIVEEAFSRALGPGSNEIRYADTEWREVLAQLPSDTLSVFIVDQTVVFLEGWESIKEDYLVLKRYDLSIQDLETLNYQLTYPPDERMQGMKVFPPD